MAPELMTITRSMKMYNWSPDYGYKKGYRQQEYPLRIFNARQGEAFHVMMQVSLDDIEYLCAGVIEGFKVTLNTPGDMRRSSTRYFNALLSEQVDIFIDPKMITTSKKLRRYKPIQRQCFFNFDRNLRFFKIYTKSNCEAECIANYTLLKCGCVKFSMPRKITMIKPINPNSFLLKPWFLGDKNTKICGTGRAQCYRDAEKKLFGEDVIDHVRKDSSKVFRATCDCLPACTSIKYSADIDRTKFDYMRIIESLGLSNTNMTRFVKRFKNSLIYGSITR